MPNNKGRHWQVVRVSTVEANREAPQEAALVLPRGVCIQGLVGGAPAQALSLVTAPIWDPRAELLGTSTLARHFR